MSSPSRKDKIELPHIEQQLTDNQKELLAKAVGESVESSGASALPSAGNVPMAATFAEAISVPPVLPNEAIIQQHAALSMGAAIGAIPQNDPVSKMATAMLQQQIEAAGAMVAAAPIQTAAAQINYQGRKVTIPESVRDVPNKITVNTPEKAYDLYQFFLSELSDETYDRLLELANRSNSKPLMWLSEKLYFVLQVERWTPPKFNSASDFNSEDANPASQSYQVLMQTFGIDCGSAILVTAERLDMGVLALIAQVAEKIDADYQALIKSNSSSQTVDSYKRKQKAV